MKLIRPINNATCSVQLPGLSAQSLHMIRLYLTMIVPDWRSMTVVETPLLPCDDVQVQAVINNNKKV